MYGVEAERTVGNENVLSSNLRIRRKSDVGAIIFANTIRIWFFLGLGTAIIKGGYVYPLPFIYCVG